MKVGHPDYQLFKVGDLAFRKIPKRGNSAVNKLKSKYEGPFRVKEVNENGVTYDHLITDRDAYVEV